MSAAEEMEAGRKQSEYWANLGASRPQAKPDASGEDSGAAPVNTDIVAAAPGNQRQAEGAKCETPPSVEDFFARILVWHSESTPGFCNIHWRNPKFEHGMPGKPYTRLIDFMAGRDWLVAHPNIAKDIWFATGQQKNTAVDPAKALRNRANTTLMKSIFLDIDIKDPPKGYTNLAEALDALKDFTVRANITFPSAIVGSGGGLHAYWISDRPLTVDEWQPYADGLRALAVQHGLRCYGSVTIDCARVLRVPGTINNKMDPGRPVELLDLAKEDMTFDAKLGHIRSAINPTVHRASAAPATKRNWVAALEPETPDAELKATKSLATETERPPVDITQVIKECPFFRHTFDTGGRDADQGLWMMTVLASTFVKGGQKLAHFLSKGHKTYVPAETDAMYERKEREKEERSLGWPSCTTFEQYGSKQCASCPYKGKIKSPLNLTGPIVTVATRDNIGGPVVPKDDHMGRSHIYRKEKRPNLRHYRDDYYDYEGGHYVMVDDHTIAANLYSFLDKCRKEVLRGHQKTIVPFEPDTKSIHETINALKAVGHLLPTIEQPYWLDGHTGPDPAHLICFPNGILNLSTNEFTPPDPMLFTSHGVAFDYGPNAPVPVEWLKFLNQIFGGEQDQIDSLQETFGYCISNDVSQEKVFLDIGPKRSGKDTKRHTLQSLISPKAVCGPTLDSMGTNFGMSAFIGKQLAIVGDMRLGSKCDKDLLAENILKLSGRGLFTIDRKHKDHWTGPLPCKLLLISNEMPKIKDTSGALASRMIIFQTRVSFYGREDPHLFRDKIRPELPGILNWSLEGLRRIRHRGSIAEPACSIEAREELAREGSPIMAFVQECLTLDPGAIVNKDVMYSTYLDYADNNGLHRASKSWFFRDLETATAGKVKAERVQKDGERVHIIVGAKISIPPPKRQWNGDGRVPQAPVAPTTRTSPHERIKAGIVMGSR